MWNAESYPWHECALKTSRGGPSRLTTFKPTRGPAFPARSGRSPVTTSSLKLLPSGRSLRSGRWLERPGLTRTCLPRPLPVISSGAESKHLYESGGTERTCLSSGRLLHFAPPSVGTSVEATCIRWRLPPSSTTGHVERIPTAVGRSRDLSPTQPPNRARCPPRQRLCSGSPRYVRRTNCVYRSRPLHTSKVSGHAPRPSLLRLRP